MTPAALAVLHARCFTTPRPWSAAEFSDLLAHETSFLLTGTQAFLLGRVVAGEAELLTLAVHPDHRRAGLGAGLVAQFLGTAKTRQAQDAFLEVADDNAAAIALYRKQGFEQTARRKGYYRQATGGPLDAIIMTQKLISPTA